MSRAVGTPIMTPRPSGGTTLYVRGRDLEEREDAIVFDSGEAENWWQRLNKALGTTSSDFVNASLLQLQAAARSPFGTISGTLHECRARVDRSRSAEEMKLRQRSPSRWPARTPPPWRFSPSWTAALATERRIAAFGSAAARLLRAYAIQVEVLRRLRNGGQQYVRVEHVHVNVEGRPSLAM